MNERDKDPERTGQARGIEANEPPRFDRIGYRDPGRLLGLSLRLWRVAIRTEPAITRIIFDQQRHARAGDRRKDAEDEIGLAPSDGGDEKRHDRRHQGLADTKPPGRAT